jgi:hypothetical protein
VFYNCSQSVILNFCAKILQKCKLFKKNKTESVGAVSVPNPESVQTMANKGKKMEHKKTISTKLANKSKVQKQSR